ncbi:hypothetical protein JKP88DRAFT_201323 [Tribonema minus]|uniref:CS domain-containing protein n=1 Tax=Tribonema minus TaxID=303371 RepID=A0A836CBM1_9STRA|nr:hypothetical protein JKP88DRAFT_201323 [Tribonema minus]
MRALLLLATCLTLGMCRGTTAPLEAADDQGCLTAVLAAQGGLAAESLGVALQRGWWACSEELIKRLAVTMDKDLDHIFQMEQRSITRQLNSLKSVLEASKPMQQLSPAFEWAQSGNEVFISVKFAHKVDAPATLGVAVDSVDMVGDRVTLKASTTGRKQFLLDLQLFGDIDPEASTWQLGSVGRCTLQLKKMQEKPSRWPSLLKEGFKKPPNMHFWYDKHESYSEELETLEEQQEGQDLLAKMKAADKREEEEKAAAKGGDVKAKADVSDKAKEPAKDNDKPKEAPVRTLAQLAAASRQAKVEEAKKAVAKERKEALQSLEKDFKARKRAMDKELERKREEVRQQYDKLQDERVNAAYKAFPLADEL